MAYTNGKDFEYKVNKKIVVLGTNSRYSNIFSTVAWNGFENKYDIRRWKLDEQGTLIPTKGISLTSEEMSKLKKALNEIDNLDDYLAQFGD